MNDIEKLIEQLTIAQVDYAKLFDKGNKSASTRLRNILEDVSKGCKDLKKKALEHKKNLPAKG